MKGVFFLAVQSLAATTALADPVALTTEQMDAVVAGGANFVITPGHPEGRYKENNGRALNGITVYPGFNGGLNYVQPPGNPDNANLVFHNGVASHSLNPRN